VVERPLEQRLGEGVEVGIDEVDGLPGSRFNLLRGDLSGSDELGQRYAVEGRVLIQFQGSALGQSDPVAA
jgi:hypothetical protein